MSRKIILFDMDGVIADSWQAFYQTWKNFLEQKGFHELANETQLLRLFEGNFFRNVSLSVQPYQITQNDIEQLSHQLTTAMTQCQPFPDIAQTLYQLKTHFPLYLITSNFANSAQHFLTNHGLNVFQAVLGFEVHPNKTVKIKQIQKQLPDHQLIFVADTLGDLIESSQTSAISIAASWGWHTRETLSQGAPDVILDSPAELLDYIIQI